VLCLVVGANVPSNLASSLIPSVANNISGSVISAGISTAATSGMCNANAATLNPGQDSYCAKQLQGTQKRGSPWYSADIPATLSSFTPSVYDINASANLRTRDADCALGIFSF